MKKKKRKKTRSFQRIIILKLSSVDQPWQPKFAQKIFMNGSWIFNSNCANVHISCFLETPENQRLRIHWRLSTILTTSNRSAWSMFLICKSMYILKVYWIHYRLRSNTNVNTKFFSGKTIQKMSSYFFRELQLVTVFLLIRGSYMSWNTRFVSLNLCLGFSIFDSVLFLIKFIFLFNKMQTLWL